MQRKVKLRKLQNGGTSSNCGTLKFDLRVERSCINLQKKDTIVKYEPFHAIGRFELPSSDTKTRKTSSIVDEKVSANKNLESYATSNVNSASTAASEEKVLEDWWIGKLGITNLKSRHNKGGSLCAVRISWRGMHLPI